jgi:WD40 repeat protein
MRRTARSFLFIKIYIIALLTITSGNRISSGQEANPQRCKPSSSEIHQLELSPDGKYILASWDIRAILWNIQTGELIHSFDDGTGSLVRSVKFSPDGQTILTSSRDQATLWKTTTGNKLKSFTQDKALISDTNYVAIKAEFTPDGKRILTASDNGIILWDVASGRKLHSFAGEFPVFAVNYNWISADGKYILTFTHSKEDERIGDWTVWNVVSGEREHLIKSVEGAEFTPDRNSIMTYTRNSLDIWGLPSFQLAFDISSPLQIGRTSISQNGAFLAVFLINNSERGKDVPLELWNLDNKTLLHTFALSDTGGHIVEFTPDSKYLIIAEPTTDGPEMSLWDIRTMKEVKRFPYSDSENPSGLEQLVFIPRSLEVIIGSSSLQLWDLNTGTIVRKFCV